MNKKRAAVIFAAVLSCYAISATTASYYSAKTGGNDVGVAKFSVAFTPQENDNVVINNDNSGVDYATQNYTLTVESESEVAVGYTIIFRFNKEVPSAVNFHLDDSATPFERASDNKTFTALGRQFSADDENATHIHTVTVKALLYDEAETQEILSDIFTDRVTITVRAEQISSQE